MALSADLSRISTSAPSLGKRLMPIDAVTKSSWPSTRNGRASDCRILRATPATASLLPTSLRSSVNSSPPRREIVSEARTAAGRPPPRAQPLRDLREELVADRVPEAVVDELEVIEVEIHHRERPAVALRLRDGGEDAVAEEEAVRKTGERVVIRLILELLLRCLALRDVAIVDDDRADARLVQEVLREAFEPDPRAVLVEEAELALELAVRRLEEIGEELARDLALARMDEAENAGAEEIGLAVTEKALGRGAGVGEGEAVVQQHDAAPALLDDGAEALLASLELLLRAAALGDVADERGEGLLAAAADRIDGDLDGDPLAAGARAVRFDAAPLRAGGGGHDVGRQRPSQHLARRHPEDRLGLRIPLDHVAVAVDGDDGVERRVDELLEARLRLAQRLLGAVALERFAEEAGGRAEKRNLVFGEEALGRGEGEEHAEDARGGGDGDAGAAADAVVVAQVRRLEARLFAEVREDHRRAGDGDVHRDRLVLLVVAVAVIERFVRADGSAQDRAPRGGDLEHAAVIDGERELHERAGLAEEDVGIDAGERGLAELRDRGLLAVARLDLRAQTRELRDALRTSAGNEMQRLLQVRHDCERSAGHYATERDPAHAHPFRGLIHFAQRTQMWAVHEGA